MQCQLERSRKGRIKAGSSAEVQGGFGCVALCSLFANGTGGRHWGRVRFRYFLVAFFFFFLNNEAAAGSTAAAAGAASSTVGTSGVAASAAGAAAGAGGGVGVGVGSGVAAAVTVGGAGGAAAAAPSSAGAGSEVSSSAAAPSPLPLPDFLAAFFASLAVFAAAWVVGVVRGALGWGRNERS